MLKSDRALQSARLLLAGGDMDGACNRAYYAMFDAARAALIASGAAVEPEMLRTHSGLISAFSLHLVKPGRIALEHGRALNKVEGLRLIADYKGDAVTHGTGASQQFCGRCSGGVFGLSRCNRALAGAEMKRWIAQASSEIGGGTPEELGAFIASEGKRWTAFVKAKNIRMEPEAF